MENRARGPIEILRNAPARYARAPPCRTRQSGETFRRLIDGASNAVIPSRADGEGPRKRSLASAIHHAFTLECARFCRVIAIWQVRGPSPSARLGMTLFSRENLRTDPRNRIVS